MTLIWLITVTFLELYLVNSMTTFLAFFCHTRQSRCPGFRIEMFGLIAFL